MNLEKKLKLSKKKKRKILAFINDLGGCDADDDYFKGWDKAVDTIYDQIDEMVIVKAAKSKRNGRKEKEQK